MCLLDGVLIGVQEPRWVVHQRLLFVSSLSGSGASNHAPPTVGIAVVLTYIATAIPLRWERMMARSKAHDPVYRFRGAAADRADNNVADMAIPLAPLNLHRDLRAPTGATRAMSFRLI